MNVLRDFLANRDLSMIAAGLSGFFAAYIVVSILLRLWRTHQKGAEEIVVTETTQGVLRSFLPMAHAIGTMLHQVMSGANPDTFYYRFKDGLSRKLAAAGNPEGLNADEYVGFGLLDGLLWGTITLSLYGMMYPERIFTVTGLYLAGMGFAVGCFLWKNWLTTRLRERQTSIRKQLPFALDLLTLSMEAGLDFTSALSRIVGKMTETPLGQELSLMLHEIQLGKTRSDALRDFAARCDVQEVRTVVASLVQAEELGASIGPVLRIQAAQQRERRSQQAEEKAMKAPVKMLFPMVIIVSIVLLIIAAPIGLAWMMNE